MPPSLAPYIDHTRLDPRAGPADVERLCAEARAHGFASVCVHGVHVERCVRALAGSPVAVGTVVGFPLGASLPEVKLLEARRALELGATEVDAVLALWALGSGPGDGGDALVEEELRRLAELVHQAGGRLKAILETGLLDPDEKARACRLACAAGADFVKTSTGFAGGASLEDVRLLRWIAPPGVGIKASGGIRTAAQAWALVEAGATRLGTSRALELLS